MVLVVGVLMALAVGAQKEALAVGAQKEELAALLAGGRFGEASSLVQQQPEASFLENAIVSGLSEWRGMLSGIVALSKKESEVTAPAFRWAQNDTAIFVEIKFSARLSAPASTDVVVDSAAASEKGFEVLASSQGGDKRWGLSLSFWGDIEALAAQSETSAGRTAFVLKKRDGSSFRWPRLQLCEVTAPPNAALWLDMQEAQGFSEDRDDDDDDDDGEKCLSLREAQVLKTSRGDLQEPSSESTTTTTKTSPQKKKTTKKKTKTTKTTTTPSKKAPSNDNNATTEKDVEVKRLREEATRARKALSDETSRMKKRIEADGRALARDLKEDIEARHFYLSSPEAMAWAKKTLPPRLVVRDGLWDLFGLVADAHRAGTTTALQERASRAMNVAAAATLAAGLGAFFLPFFLLRSLFLLALLGAIGALAAARLLLTVIDDFKHAES